MKRFQVLSSKFQESGQSLVELVIAIAIFAVVISAGFAIFYGGQALSGSGTQSQQALRLARDGLEGTRAIRDNNWGNLSDGNHGIVFSNGNWQFSGASDSHDPFIRTIGISTITTDIKKIHSTVSWPDVDGTKQVDLVETLSNWQNGGLFGDWTHPILIGSGDIGAGNQGTGIAYQNTHVYLTGSASNAAKPDLFIFDVANPDTPVLKSMLNIETGLAAISVQGNYAYVIEDSSPDVFVVDISNDANPVKVAKLTLAGGDGLSVFAYGNYLYAGTTQGGAKEFFVIDISNPLSPVVRSSVNITGNVASIGVLGTTAYLATTNKDSEMMIYDVTNPNNPIFKSSYDALGDSELGKSIHAKTTGHIYLSRLNGGNHTTHHEFHIIDASNPLSPIRLGSKDIPSDVNDLYTVSFLSFLATSDTNKEFQILKIDSPSSITAYGSLNLPNIATGLAYNSNIVYVVTRSNDALKVITSSP